MKYKMQWIYDQNDKYQLSQINLIQWENKI